MRYIRISWFWVRLLLHLLWWDGLCKLPVLNLLRPAPEPRWQRLARRFRMLAHREGGLLIKVGQFLSLRVDLLPQIVCDELALLQDQVPAVPWARIRPHIEADLGMSVAQLFAWITPTAVASASVAQVHTAQLQSGERVVVKVVRPRVPEEFAMDLKFFALQIKLFNLIPMFRRTFTFSQLLQEFTRVTMRELDLVEEGHNAQRFAKNFAGDDQIYVPTIYWHYSGAYTLTMEDVNFLSLKNLAAIEAVGIDTRKIAPLLAEYTVKQIFVFNFVHADPHPGNIFIKPLPLPQEKRADFLPGEIVPYATNRPFQIVFIDFGMAVAIPPAAQAWLREFIIGMGMNDAKRIIRAYERGGLLSPDVDVARVEAMTVDLLDGMQGLLVGIMPDPEDPKTKRFFAKHSDVTGPNFPFRIPMDLLFMYRAMSTMGYVVTRIDPQYDLTTAVAPVALRFLMEEWQNDIQERIQAFSVLGRLLTTYPIKVDQILLQAQRTFQLPETLQQLFIPSLQPRDRAYAEMNSHDRQTLQQLERSVRYLHYSVVIMSAITITLMMMALFFIISAQQMNWSAVLETALQYVRFG